MQAIHSKIVQGSRPVRGAPRVRTGAVRVMGRCRESHEFLQVAFVSPARALVPALVPVQGAPRASWFGAQGAIRLPASALFACQLDILMFDFGIVCFFCRKSAPTRDVRLSFFFFSFSATSAAEKVDDARSFRRSLNKSGRYVRQPKNDPGSQVREETFGRPPLPGVTFAGHLCRDPNLPGPSSLRTAHHSRS